MLTAPFRWLMSLPVWVVSAPRRVLGLSMPMRAALFVLIFLVTCTVVSIIVEGIMRQGTPSFRSWLENWPAKVMLLLVIVIPVTVYYWLKMWLEGDVSRFPDLDDAWKAGVAALESKGIDISTTPLFLVVGAPGEKSARTLFQASTLDLIIHEVPPGKAPLQWYSDGHGIYLVCHDASCLSKLHQHAAAMGGVGVQSDPRMVERETTAQAGIRGTMVAGGGSIRSTSTVSTQDSGPPASPAALRGTLVAGAGIGESVRPDSGGDAPSSGSMLTRRELDEQTERLSYVCHLIRQARQPVCPLNGILTVLPFSIMQNVMAAREMPTAAKLDLETIRDHTRLRCPVTVLVVGMEHETGFSELVRRVGASRAKANRFGKGYDVWNAPTGENIDALSAHACGAFEDWVYNLFREKDGLNKPGNAKLYALLCKIRGNLRARLRGILLNGFSFDPSDKQASNNTLLFGGCYFAATGETEDRQAFVKSVFDKMVDLQEELEWTDDALMEDDRFHGLARLGMAYSGVMILVLVGMIVFKFING
jgi:hypothetical protein